MQSVITNITDCMFINILILLYYNIFCICLLQPFKCEPALDNGLGMNWLPVTTVSWGDPHQWHAYAPTGPNELSWMSILHSFLTGCWWQVLMLLQYFTEMWKRICYHLWQSRHYISMQQSWHFAYKRHKNRLCRLTWQASFWELGRNVPCDCGRVRLTV